LRQLGVLTSRDTPAYFAVVTHMGVARMRVPARALVIGSALVAAAVGAIVFSIPSAADNDVQPGLVEDFSYPGAQQILSDRGILLISGDGHLQLVRCGQAGWIEVRASTTADHDSDPGHYCFKATGPTAYLKLQLADAYQVKGDDHAVKATVSVKGQTSTVDVDRNGWTGIGFGAPGGNDPAMLLELRATP
jgi:hypothetical protein